MPRFECVRIDPTAEELASLLAAAAAGANESAPLGPLTWPPAGLAEVLAAGAREPAGYRQWLPEPSLPDLEDARKLGTLRLLGREASALAFSPDGQRLAVGFEGGVVLWPWRELLEPAPESGA
jgi:hypothetical protein